MKRRRFIHLAAMSAASAVASKADAADLQQQLPVIASTPALDLSSVKQPVKIASLELLRNGNVFLLRTRSSDGLEVITVPNPARMSHFYPVLIKRVIPSFIGKDARDIETLLWDVYRESSNYKLQGIALWVCVAAVEMALLELLGRASDQPVAEFFGGIRQREINVYSASSNRGNAPEAELEHLQNLVARSGAKALKFRLGGRMSRNRDSRPGRTEALIAKTRDVFGKDFVLYGDSNSSYDVPEAIRIGRLMEEHDFGFFEEPCEFDDLWGTKQVSDRLSIPVAGGEQEFSLHRWQWVIANRAVDIVQPDLHYGGGFIRATKVARMAEAAGMKVVPHMSGGGLGYVEVVHFASFTPNIGPFMEFKGNSTLPVHCDSSPLRSINGSVLCPTGSGFGIEMDRDFVQQAKRVEA